MRRFLLFAASVAILTASPGFSQQVRITGRGSDGADHSIRASNTGELLVDGTPDTTAGAGANTVQGSDAQGAVPAGNPLVGGCLASATAPTAVTAGQARRNWCNLSGAQSVSIVNAAGASPQIATIPVTAVATTTTALSTAAFQYNFDGTSWQVGKGDTFGAYVTGPDAQGVAPTGKPVTSGCVGATAPAAVTAGQVVRGWCNLNGATVTIPYVAGLVPTSTVTSIAALYGQDGVTRPASTAAMYQDGTTFRFAGGDANGAYMQGNIASGVTDAGNPIEVGGYGSTAIPTAVTNGQRVKAWFQPNGSQNVSITDSAGNIINAGGFNADAGTSLTQAALRTVAFGFGFDGTNAVRVRADANGAVSQTALVASQWTFASGAGGTIINTTGAVQIAAGAVGVRTYLTSIQISTDALSAATELTISDSSANILWRGKLQAGVNNPAPLIFNIPLKTVATNSGIWVAETVATGAAIGIYINAQGYRSAL